MSAGSGAWGWRLLACGFVLGVLAAVWRLPYFWTTAQAQVMATVWRVPEWSRAAVYGRPAPALKRALAAAPNDAALQMGGASWERSAAGVAEAVEPASCGNSYRHDTFLARGALAMKPEELLAPPGSSGADEEPARLDALVRRFPNDASVRAYQLRRLLGDPVWIPRAEALTPKPAPHPSPSGPFGLGPPGPEAGRAPMAPMPPMPPEPPPPPKPPPSPQALDQFDAAALAGQRLEPGNSFFDAMRAVAAFAGERDDEALRHLHTAAAKPFWNDHTSDETRAVWKLLRVAYGDCGAEQLLWSGGARLARLRDMARVAVWHAARFERAGDYPRAWLIRGDVMRLGSRIQDRDLFYMGMAPATPQAVARKSPWSESERRQRRERYAAYLKAHGGAGEAAWVRYEGERVDVVSDRARRACDGIWDRSYYWPPRGLAVWWEFGVILVHQVEVVLALWGGVVLLGLLVGRKKSGADLPAARVWFRAGPLTVGPWTAVYVALFFTPLVTSMAFHRGATDFWQVTVVVGLFMVWLLGTARDMGMRRQRRAGLAVSFPDERRTPWTTGLAAMVSVALPLALVAPCCSFVSKWTAGGSIFGLPWWGLPLGHMFPELAFLPAMLLCCLALCRAAVLGLPVVVGLCRGVRRIAPYAVALLALLYLAAAVPTSSANVAATHQIEQSLTDELSVLEAVK